MSIKIKGLTPQQEKLAQVIARQIITTGKTNTTQAGLEVFDSNNTHAARTMASQSLQNPAVQQKIDDILNSQRLTLDKNLKNLVKIANFEPEKYSGETVANINLALLKLRGADAGSKHTTLNLSITGKLKQMTPVELRNYVENMRKENDELLKEVEMLEAPK